LITVVNIIRISPVRRLLGFCLLLTVAGGCASGSGAGEDPTVVAALYPLAFMATQVGGTNVEVTNLTSAGAEPHDLELTPGQVRRVTEASLVVLVGGGLQPAVEKAATNTRGDVLDVLAIPAIERELLRLSPGEATEAHEEAEGDERPGAVDPHVWLDPRLMAEIAGSLGQRLADADAGQAAGYRARADQLASRLDKLDRALASGLANCGRREIVTSHTAFGYLARRYGLTEVGISGLSPETEPSPQRMAEVASFVRERGATTIFFETLVSPKVAESLAREVGVGTDVLDPIEGRPEGGDYFAGMERNLSILRKALDCP
jgi:zinc transport system substrate-binding protein